MENDPVLKRLLPSITDGKQMLALQHLVEQPKDSDQNIKNEMYKKMFNGDFKGMTPEDFNQTVSGLSKQDRTMAEGMYRKFNTQTPTQENQMVRNMGIQLGKELRNVGYVKKNDFGQYNNDDQIKINKANDELVDALDRQPQMSLKEQSQFVQKFAADKLKGQVFKAPEKQPVKVLYEKQPSTTKTAQLETDESKRQNVQRKFRQENKRWPTPQELESLLKTASK
jgi:hypothetical protein